MPHSESVATIFEYLKYFHGAYNGFMMLLFMYQGWLGFRIRRERRLNMQPPFKSIKTHRRFGPFLALFGVSGFIAGAGIVYLGEGKILEHPLHFFTGLAIVVVIGVTFRVSRLIRAETPSLRDAHALLGIVILGLYLAQAFLGLTMLLQ